MLNSQPYQDNTTRSGIEVYQELQQLWTEAYLPLEHIAQQAARAAASMGLTLAAEWIKQHPLEYEQGYNSGCWGLDASKFDGNVVCCRVGTTALTNVPRSVVHSSPDGHEWGYGGSGPHDLALDVLNWFTPPVNQSDRVECYRGYCSKTAWQLKRKFCLDFIDTMPAEGGTISASAIRNWLVQQQAGESLIAD